jgi:hypothetical protein
MLMSHHHNAGENHRSFENVEKLKYLGTAMTNKNLILEEIKNK